MTSSIATVDECFVKGTAICLGTTLLRRTRRLSTDTSSEWNANRDDNLIEQWAPLDSGSAFPLGHADTTTSQLGELMAIRHLVDMLGACCIRSPVPKPCRVSSLKSLNPVLVSWRGLHERLARVEVLISTTSAETLNAIQRARRIMKAPHDRLKHYVNNCRSVN